MFSLFLFSLQGKTQTRYFTTIFPGISVSSPFSDKSELNLSSSAQYNTLAREYDGTSYPAAFNYVDFQIGAVYKYNQHIHIAAAWYYRNTDPGRSSSFSENRFWQQVTFISRIGNLRFRNRLRMEERLITRNGRTEPLKWRLRYQTGFEIPLQGEKTDIKEFYTVLLNEAYFSLSKPPFRILWRELDFCISGLPDFRKKQVRGRAGMANSNPQYRKREKQLDSFTGKSFNTD